MDERRTDRSPALSRRGFLAGLAAAGAAGLVASCSSGSSDSKSAPTTEKPVKRSTGVADPKPNVQLPENLFALGVASGDPLSDRVILWTRLAPSPLEGGGMPEVEVPVRWQVASDERFTAIVADGIVNATPEHAHAVHVDATGLQPARPYWYRFTTGGQESPAARTRTAPAAGSTVASASLLFASCQDWRDGYWTSWPHAAEEDVDLVAFLGDYIYEGGPSSGVRQHGTEATITLADYRNRYGLYKGDPGLQAAHAMAPWVMTWDDHEVQNNYAGELSQDPTVPIEEFRKRRAAGYQAFWEHSPVRAPAPVGDAMQLYRTVPWGDLADFVVLDGRQYRSDQPCGKGGDIGGDCAERKDPAQTMLGEAQKAWLGQQLQDVDGRWTMVANQTIMTPVPIGPVFNLDQWDGYPAERTEVLEMLGQVDNAVVITGDIHANGVADLQDSPAGSKVVGTELVGGSISSEFDPSLVTVAEKLIGEDPQVKWFDGRHHGYVRVDLTPDELKASYRAVSTVAEPTGDISTSRSWVVEAGKPGPQEA